MDVFTVVLFGLGGGISAEVLKWFRIREELHTGIPDYAKEWPYWFVTSIMIVMGGGLAFAYHVSSEVRLSPILAINVGASAPLILSALAAQSPSIGAGTVD